MACVSRGGRDGPRIDLKGGPVAKQTKLIADSSGMGTPATSPTAPTAVPLYAVLYNEARQIYGTSPKTGVGIIGDDRALGASKPSNVGLPQRQPSQSPSIALQPGRGALSKTIASLAAAAAGGATVHSGVGDSTKLAYIFSGVDTSMEEVRANNPRYRFTGAGVGPVNKVVNPIWKLSAALSSLVETISARSNGSSTKNDHSAPFQAAPASLTAFIPRQLLGRRSTKPPPSSILPASNPPPQSPANPPSQSWAKPPSESQLTDHPQTQTRATAVDANATAIGLAKSNTTINTHSRSLAPKPATPSKATTRAIVQSSSPPLSTPPALTLLTITPRGPQPAKDLSVKTNTGAIHTCRDDVSSVPSGSKNEAPLLNSFPSGRPQPTSELSTALCCPSVSKPQAAAAAPTKSDDRQTCAATIGSTIATEKLQSQIRTSELQKRGNVAMTPSAGPMAENSTGGQVRDRKSKDGDDGDGDGDGDARGDDDEDDSKRPTRETDPRRLDQRQKQLDYGTNTIGYTNYTNSVPRERRDWGERLGLHPRTPDRNQICSSRSWNGQLSKWRRLLHQWDTLPPIPIGTIETIDPASMKKSLFRGSDASPSIGSASTPARSPHSAPSAASAPSAPSAPHECARATGGAVAAGSKSGSVMAGTNMSFRNVADQLVIRPKIPIPTDPAETGPKISIPTGQAENRPKIPIPMGPAATGPKIPVPTGPAENGPKIPVPTGPAENGPKIPVPTDPAENGPKIPVPTGPAENGPKIPIPMGPAENGPKIPIPTDPAETGPKIPIPTGPAETGPKISISTGAAQNGPKMAIPTGAVETCARDKSPSRTFGTGLSAENGASATKSGLIGRKRERSPNPFISVNRRPNPNPWASTSAKPNSAAPSKRHCSPPPSAVRTSAAEIVRPNAIPADPGNAKPLSITADSAAICVVSSKEANLIAKDVQTKNSATTPEAAGAAAAPKPSPISGTRIASSNGTKLSAERLHIKNSTTSATAPSTASELHKRTIKVIVGTAMGTGAAGGASSRVETATVSAATSITNATVSADGEIEPLRKKARIDANALSPFEWLRIVQELKNVAADDPVKLARRACAHFHLHNLADATRDAYIALDSATGEIAASCFTTLARIETAKNEPQTIIRMLLRRALEKDPTYQPARALFEELNASPSRLS